MISGQWAAFHSTRLPAFQGQEAKDRQPQAFCLLCMFCQTSLLRSLKVQRREVQAPHTPPTNMPIQLKLVLLKEVGHFMSRHITFMRSQLSLLEKQGNLFILAAFPFLPKLSPLMTIMQGDGKSSLWVSIHPKQHFTHLGSLSRLSVWIREQYGFATVNKASYVPPVVTGCDRKGKCNFREGITYAFMHIMKCLFLSVEEAPLRRSPAVV